MNGIVHLSDLDHRTLEHVAYYASEEDRSELGTHV